VVDEKQHPGTERFERWHGGDETLLGDASFSTSL
jgi:hypothetical protein